MNDTRDCFRNLITQGFGLKDHLMPLMIDIAFRIADIDCQRYRSGSFNLKTDCLSRIEQRRKTWLIPRIINITRQIVSIFINKTILIQFRVQNQLSILIKHFQIASAKAIGRIRKPEIIGRHQRQVSLLLQTES
ncbi:hypothetical protein SDC9_135166 [bioreactor metagenome]|uniref:Uncharacterized protein n=1 Tax=bioreactor metagenome TaxID=1076179 RepID=A0A645DFR5_9ZZZZ